MGSDTDKGGQPTAGLPFVRPVARQIVEELFRAQSQWKTAALVDRVVQVHRERGGSTASNPSFTIQRALRDLKEGGLVNSPGVGWWCWTGASPQGLPVQELPPTVSTSLVDDPSDNYELTIQPDKEVGTGSECVYLYFNPNDRRLAALEGRDTWECKIGRTGKQ